MKICAWKKYGSQLVFQSIPKVCERGEGLGSKEDQERGHYCQNSSVCSSISRLEGTNYEKLPGWGPETFESPSRSKIYSVIQTGVAHFLHLSAFFQPATKAIVSRKYGQYSVWPCIGLAGYILAVYSGTEDGRGGGWVTGRERKKHFRREKKSLHWWKGDWLRAPLSV